MRADWEREALAAIEDAAMRVDGHVSTRAIEVILDAVEPFIRADERATPPPWVLRCAICLHKPPGDRDITTATPALTVMDGLAVCEEHVEWVPLGDEIEESLLEERNR